MPITDLLLYASLAMYPSFFVAERLFAAPALLICATSARRLSTDRRWNATGLVFFGDDSGAFAAADAANGKPLWSFLANANWHASPMAYQFDGQQYIAIASGGDILAFGLIE